MELKDRHQGEVCYKRGVSANRKDGILAEGLTCMAQGALKTEKNTYKYEGQDEKGNWTKRTNYNNKEKPIQIRK